MTTPNPQVNLQAFSDYKLCFVCRNLCYFTTGEPSHQNGYNWHYVEYESTADPPYPIEGESVLTVAIDAKLDTPDGRCSPSDVNQKHFPWLHSWDFVTVIHAGITLPDFVLAINHAGGRVFFDAETYAKVIQNDQTN